MTNDAVDQWSARYPDLVGKAVVIAGDGRGFVALAEAFAGAGALVAVVADDHHAVAAATRAAEARGATAYGFTADPANPAVWQRVAPHVEQRLGPIDVVVVAGAPDRRAVAIEALRPDMAARRRGVIVEIGDAATTTPADGVRVRLIHPANDPADVTATALLCASDALAAPTLTISWFVNR
ncbi:MAG TPA: SDR family NAD(P)-dependent oxidoreductase [Mycobacteriales bacterium]|nr:SDR family NAD(P)-dependent oxidoreductase [Mycobacteriales bacterium]